jgi:putative transposase
MLLGLLREAGWQLEAWAVLSNHYHFVGHSQPAGEGAAISLGNLLQKLHSLSTKEANRREGKPGRSRLWQNYRETLITFQSSYLARLNYVHQNPVHHGLVTDARDWKWGSAARFEQSVTPAWAKTIRSFSFEKIAEEDGE